MDNQSSELDTAFINNRFQETKSETEPKHVHLNDQQIQIDSPNVEDQMKLKMSTLKEADLAAITSRNKLIPNSLIQIPKTGIQTIENLGVTNSK